MSRDFLAELADAALSGRPAHRIVAADIDLDQTEALLCVDAVRLGTVAATDCSTAAVELKPKWGFVVEPDPVDQSDVQCHRRPCRYCQHQTLKRRTGAIEVESGFCPLALFCTRSPACVTGALHCLLANPQNNLKVFSAQHGGSLALSGTLGGGQQTGCSADVAAAVLLPSAEHLVAGVQRALRETKVLEHVLALQRLDRFGIAHAIVLHRQANIVVAAAGAPRLCADCELELFHWWQKRAEVACDTTARTRLPPPRAACVSAGRAACAASTLLSGPLWRGESGAAVEPVACSTAPLVTVAHCHVLCRPCAEPRRSPPRPTVPFSESPRQWFADAGVHSLLDALGVLVDLLVAATLKDCSLMVRLASEHGEPVAVQLLDLDSKPAARLEAHYALERQLREINKQS